MSAMFSVTGRLRETGQPATLTVELGDVPDERRFSGDIDAQIAVRMLILLGEEIRQTPTGPNYQAALDPPHVALLTVLRAFESWDVELAGDVPEIPHVGVPPGAVA